MGNREAGADPLPLSGVVTEGSFCEPLLCSEYTKCEKAVKDTRCGWDHIKGKALQGTKEGPCFGTSKKWDFVYCSGSPCSAKKSCTECVADPFCGFCEDDRTCSEGSKDFPNAKICNQWHHYECPVPIMYEKLVVKKCADPKPTEQLWDPSFLQA